MLCVGEHTLERQCDPEYINELKDVIGDYDAVISIACGVGPQFLSERYPDKRIFPGVNTKFMGGAVEHGVWAERCAGCGTCVIHLFGGLCPHCPMFKKPAERPLREGRPTENVKSARKWIASGT